MTETGWRFLTALTLIPVVAMVVLGLPDLVFRTVLVLVLATAAWEWSRISGLTPAPAYAAAIGVCAAIAAGAGGVVPESLAWLGVGWWLLAFAAVVRFRGEPAPSLRRPDRVSAPVSGRGSGPAPEAGGASAAGLRPGIGNVNRPARAQSTPLEEDRPPAGAGSRPLRPGPGGVSAAASSARLRGGLAGWLVLVPAGAALAALHARPDGPVLVMTLLAVVWAADSGAWFAGRRFGRTRLAPRISPGKTWEGVAGGLLAGAAVAAAAAWWLALAPPRGLLLAAVLAAGASVIGDLYESLSKRRAGVKDSGRLLPGHGGMLDRIDGLAAAAPVYAVATAAA